MIRHGSKNFILAFGPYVVGGGCHANIAVQPQIWMRVNRLWVSREVGKAFMLGDIQVGKNSQFANVAEFSMAIFDNDQLHEPGQYPDPCIGVISPAVYVGFRVRNRLPVSAEFSGHIEGEIVNPDEDEKKTSGLKEDWDWEFIGDEDTAKVKFYCKECGATRESVGVPEEPCVCGSKKFEVAP